MSPRQRTVFQRYAARKDTNATANTAPVSTAEPARSTALRRSLAEYMIHDPPIIGFRTAQAKEGPLDWGPSALHALTFSQSSGGMNYRTTSLGLDPHRIHPSESRKSSRIEISVRGDG